MDQNDELLIDGAASLLPDLTIYGLEEVEPGVTYDNYESRTVLRDSGLTWLPVYRASGEPTNLIQVITPEMRTARMTANKGLILIDSRDPDSDYLTGDSLLLEKEAYTMVPVWVINTTRQWDKIETERNARELASRETGELVKVYRPSIAGPPTRCRARRADGHRCENWWGGSAERDGLCKLHFGSKTSNPDTYGTDILTRAKNRLISASLGAADVLEDLMQNATSEPVRAQAAKEILDRAGIRAGFEIDAKVDVNAVPADQIVRDRLGEIAANVVKAQQVQAALAAPADSADSTANETDTPAEEIVEAEIVESE